MSGTQLSPELCDPLPAILAGPMIRRLTRSRVHIWLATSTGQTLTLKVRRRDLAGSWTDFAQQPRRIGENLWLSVIPADGIDVGPAGSEFAPGVTYEYWIDLGDGSPGATDWSLLAYGGGQYPSFVGLPTAADQFRILHGSCRKPHGGGRDGLALIDALIEGNRFPDESAPGRPHLMFLTGDQIYADDVAAPLMPVIRTIRDDLVGVDEAAVFTRADGTSLLDLKVNGRQQACYEMGLTSEVAHDHLWALGEYCAMYLLAWSDTLWPAALPQWEDVVGPDQELLDGVDAGLVDPLAEQAGLSLCSRLGVCAQCASFLPYHPPGEPMGEEELAELAKVQREALVRLESSWRAHCEDLDVFRHTLPRVRRLLANVPSYMVLDDHEVTDDWNLSYRWAQAVYAAGSASQRVVVNGLLAYLLFQHWGNVPDLFATAGTAERQVLDAITLGAGPGPFAHPADDPSVAAGLLANLGIPHAADFSYPQSADGQTHQAQLRPSVGGLLPGIAYHYRLEPAVTGYPFRLIAIDGRTHREFVSTHPLGSRLSLEAVDTMIPGPAPGVAFVPTLMVVPTPLLSMHLIEHYVQPAVAVWDFGIQPSGEAFIDYEVNWLTFGERFEHVLGRIAAYQDVIVLAGDVHYGFTKRLRYFDPAGSAQPTGVVAQLTSSAIRNAETKTVAVHTFGDALMKLGLTRQRVFRVYDSLAPQQQLALLGSPSAPLPWDEAIDVVAGRPLWDSLQPPPVAFSEEIAAAYNLDQQGQPHARRYEIDHFDDDVWPPAGSGLAADMGDVAVNLGLTTATWGSTAALENAARIVRGLRAADLHRIGRVFAGLPQMGLVTLALAPPGRTRVDRVRHRIFVPVGRTNDDASGPDPWYVMDTWVPFRIP